MNTQTMDEFLHDSLSTERYDTTLAIRAMVHNGYLPLPRRINIYDNGSIFVYWKNGAGVRFFASTTYEITINDECIHSICDPVMDTSWVYCVNDIIQSGGCK